MTTLILIWMFAALSIFNTYEILIINKKIQNQREVDKLTQVMLSEHHKRIKQLEEEE